MERERKQPEPEQGGGAPEWMVTYCDCMTLMLTFFVLLFSFSSFDESVFPELSMVFAGSLSMVKEDKSAFLPSKQIVTTEEIGEGGEKPTLDRGTEDRLKKKTELINFHDRKVFLISSDKIFWGKGTGISLQGRKTLSTMASFLKEVPNRLVISENGQEDKGIDELFGLRRSWAVIEYFTTKQGLDKGRFSLAADTLQRDHENDQQGHSQAKAERTLEIVLLERSIHN